MTPTADDSHRGRYLAIEGPTGVGKTTLARALAEHLGGGIETDPFDGNPLLTALYGENAGPLALAGELAFLGLRIEALRNIRQRLAAGHLIVADWALVKTRAFPFTTLPATDAARVYACAELWRRELPDPDLTIYLRASAPVLQARIRARGRDFEQDIQASELETLSRLFDQILTGERIITIDADEFDVFDTHHVREVAARVMSALVPHQRSKDVNT